MSKNLETNGLSSLTYIRIAKYGSLIRIYRVAPMCIPIQ